MPVPRILFGTLLALLAAAPARAQGPDAPSLILSLTTTGGLDLRNVRAEPVEYRGKRALRIVPEGPDGQKLAIVAGSSFAEGTIEVDVAGSPAAGAPEGARGFVGLAFHVSPDASRYRAFYVRPTNGRADDQLRRNHSTQYVNEPDFPWHRLRREEPGVYESYVDLEPGVWTRLKVVVSATQARLYVNGSEQPALVVKDLKPGPARGAVALWLGLGTEAHFANLSIR